MKRRCHLHARLRDDSQTQVGKRKLPSLKETPSTYWLLAHEPWETDFCGHKRDVTAAADTRSPGRWHCQRPGAAGEQCRRARGRGCRAASAHRRALGGRGSFFLALHIQKSLFWEEITGKHAGSIRQHAPVRRRAAPLRPCRDDLICRSGSGRATLTRALSIKSNTSAEHRNLYIFG